MVIASKTIHSMDTSKEKAMFIKLDLAKAYDRVSWDFLGHVLLAFGFDMEWVIGFSAVSPPHLFQFLLMENLLTFSLLLDDFDRGILSLHIYL